jgi:YidC/Oxa1 family membrane protein insertase
VQQLFDIFQPIHAAWWAIFGVSMSWALQHIYIAFAGVGVLSAIGAYGAAIVALTLLVRLILAPLFQIQLVLSRRAVQGTRQVAPLIAEARKKYRNDPQKQQAEVMRIYRENGVNPLSNLSGCLPVLVQLPIWTALYYVLRGNAQAEVVKSAHFLFIPNLNLDPFHQVWGPHGLALGGLVYLIIPILAAGTTYFQTKMAQQQQIAYPAATEQEQQMQNVQKQMMLFMPLMFLYFSAIVPAGLGLYWFVSNLFAIGQQYAVNRWGGFPGLNLIRLSPAAAPAGATAGLAGTSSAAAPKRSPERSPEPKRASDDRRRRSEPKAPTDGQPPAAPKPAHQRPPSASKRRRIKK